MKRKRGAEKVGVTYGRGIIIFVDCLEGIRVCKVKGGMISGIIGSVRYSRIIKIPRFGILMNHTSAVNHHIAIHTCGGGRERVVFSHVVGRPSVSNTVVPVLEDKLGGGLEYLGVWGESEKGIRVVIGRLRESRGKDGTGIIGESGMSAYGLLYSGFLLGGEGGLSASCGGIEGRAVEITFCTFLLPPATSVVVLAARIAAVNLAVCCCAAM